MSLKHVLEAQKSGELDLLPNSSFNQCAPLTIADGYATLMINGDEWYLEEINSELVIEALELLGHQKHEVIISDTQVIQKHSKLVLFSGENISELFGEIVVKSGIYVEFM